jgi:hypothetical protein
MGEWRKVPTATLEGASADHTDYEYQFGAEIDGVFVPAVTKSGGYVDHLIARGKSDESTPQAAPQQPSEQPTTEQPTTEQPTTEGQ